MSNLTDWLPTTKKEMELRGWDELDVILFSGDLVQLSLVEYLRRKG